jgi:hypothetical protein
MKFAHPAKAPIYNLKVSLKDVYRCALQAINPAGYIYLCGEENA